MAVLDGGFARRAARFPELSVALSRRSQLRVERLATQIAAISQPRVESRLLGIFWQIADRFGTMGSDGVEIPLALTHGLLAEMIAARRPSVTAALTRLREAGLVDRRGSTWRLLRA